jgi:hypothetical protein
LIDLHRSTTNSNKKKQYDQGGDGAGTDVEFEGRGSDDRPEISVVAAWSFPSFRILEKIPAKWVGGYLAP